MKKMILIILTVFVGTNAFAKTYFEGKTKSGDTCSVMMNLENKNIFFSSNDVGFGFTVSEDDIRTALQNGQNPVIIEGGDGPVSAKLALNFDSKGNLASAVYKQRTLLVPKTIVCNNLQIQ